jgi:hypothetical protein
MNDIFAKPYAYGGFKADASDSRICFGIAWFKDEAEAKKYSEYVSSHGHTYNGGWYHGMPCGRDYGFDFVKDGVKYYAVTH